MFNFSANHLVLISRTEYPSYAVLLMQDRDTRRVYRLYDFSKAQLIRPGVAYCIAGKVNSADKLYLVIESVRLDTKHRTGFPLLLFRLTAREVPKCAEPCIVSESDLTGLPASLPTASAPVCAGVRTGANLRRHNRRNRCSFKPASTSEC